MIMRLPTLGEVVSVAQRNLARFPLVLAAGVVTSYAALAMVETDINEPGLVRLIVVGGLGLPLMFSLTVLAERQTEHVGSRFGIQGTGVALLALIWWMWPSWMPHVQGMRFAQLSAAFHLFAAFAPFIGRDEPGAFWQWNRILFIRFLLGALYSVVLFLGLAGALLALDKLLGIAIANEAYPRLWILISFVFNPWFFVAGIPDDIGALERVDEFPTGLRVFTQYVLVPIVALYLVILLIYFGKVVITREWPKGWIGNLVSSVAGVGTLSWLLVHPLERKPEHAWVKGFTRGFYVAMLPAIAMLLLAIYTRVDQYGVTERRYFLILLSVWLAATAVYYTISKSRNIKLLPASLCVVALIGLGGPWGAYAISLSSQRSRLAALLERHELMRDGTLVRATGAVSDSVAQQVSEGFRYLLERHGSATIRSWLAPEMEKSIGAIGAGSPARAESGARLVVEAINVRYFARYNLDVTGESFYFYAPNTRLAVPVDGYQFAMRLSNVSSNPPDTTRAMHATVTDSPPSIEVRRDGAILISVPLATLIDSAAARHRRGVPGGMQANALTFTHVDGDKAAFVVLTSLSGMRERGTARVNGIDGQVYVRLPSATEGRR
jgi:hypothetical protein